MDVLGGRRQRKGLAQEVPGRIEDMEARMGAAERDREARRLGLRMAASGEEERIAGVGTERTTRRVVRTIGRRRRWLELAGLKRRRRRRLEAAIVRLKVMSKGKHGEEK